MYRYYRANLPHEASFSANAGLSRGFGERRDSWRSPECRVYSPFASK